MSELVIDNVWQSYDEQVVLEGLHLRVCGPEFCAIVGASGCGKSTFLRLLLGQEQPSRGRILLDGEPLPREPGPDRGVVFQQYSVFPHLTVLENAMFGLELQRRRWDVRIGGRLWGRARGEVREQAEQALAQVGLSGARDKYPALLSGGMRQRLSLAQSIVTRPKILLLDEPFGALDPGVRSDMHELVLQLWEEHRMCVFLVTHDIAEGFKLGTRLLVFDRLRRDPQAPQAFGATITYDLPLRRLTAEGAAAQRRDRSVAAAG